MKIKTRLVTLFFGAVASAASALAASDALPEARVTVARQFEAFERGDAGAAYARATPGVKAIFPDPDTFMSMVRGHYAPVYRHRRAEFGEANVTGDSAEMDVTLTDADNVVWTAHYTFSRQADGRWLISGCQLVRAVDQST